MKSSVFWALVRKDLYLLRHIIIAMVVVGLASFYALRFGRIAFAIGGIVFLTTNIAGGIFMAMASLLGERKELARTFALSLPISGRDYALTKLVSGYLSYGIPWLVVTGVVVAAFLTSPDAPDHGMVVYALLLQFYALAMYCVLLTALFSSTSEGMSVAIILGGNMLFSLFMVQLNQPEIIGPLKTGQVVWTSFARLTLAGELVAIALSVAIALLVASRRRDYI
ncbi:MAG TPA: ABC-2 transporter permease [Steroidobacteraceae bacterium]|nr:ABC-2 transporter permease [Steroidobacteraceae bacterium]